MNKVRFLILFGSAEGKALARTVIESLRTFGGALRGSEVWAFVAGPKLAPSALPGLRHVQCFPLADEGNLRYPFAQKVAAFAQAEEMTGSEIRSLVWLSLDCLFIQPPRLFDLGPASGAEPAGASFRPVHHRNIGALASEPLDAFWQGVYQAVGIQEMPYTIESFADRQTLRPYLNSHCFALDPALGLGRAWREHFQALVTDGRFQAGPCRDEPHRIFLHQAILSSLVAKHVPWDRLRLLPPEYNYPLNLISEIPPDRRATTLNDLVCAVHEGTFPWGRIEVQEPLLSWLRERLPA